MAVDPLPSLGAQVQVHFEVRDGVITLHEPVVLLFRVHNASAEEAVLNLGVAKTQFFHFSLITPQGTTLQNEPPYTEGFYPSGKVVVPAGGDYEQVLVLNQWFQLDSAGKYSLRAQMNGAASISPDIERIPFEIKQRAPERLAKLCSDLTDQVKAAPNAQAAQQPALLLSYVEDPVAVPYLSQVLYTHKLVENTAISGLERIDSEDSVKVLISALAYSYGDTSTLAREALRRILRKTSNPALKEEIRKAGVQ